MCFLTGVSEMLNLIVSYHRVGFHLNEFCIVLSVYCVSDGRQQNEIFSPKLVVCFE